MPLPRAPLLIVLLLAIAPGLLSAQGPPDHERFTQLVHLIVQDSLVDYRTLMEHSDMLDAYVESLAQTDIDQLESAEQRVQLAFWLNAYNACMLVRVRNHYPIEPGGTGLFGGIRNWATGRPDNSVWQIRDVFTEDSCPVAGEERSLDEIEHEIIRPVFQEPRIHFAVNCAAYSCPRLAPEAYTGTDLDDQLDRQVRLFINDSRHFLIQEEGDRVTLRLNKVLDWYSEDFGGEGRLPDFFVPYLEAEDAALLGQPNVRVEFFDYDWTLNDVHADHGDPDS